LLDFSSEIFTDAATHLFIAYRRAKIFAIRIKCSNCI
jgi:hypothetical protein